MSRYSVSGLSALAGIICRQIFYNLPTPYLNTAAIWSAKSLQLTRTPKPSYCLSVFVILPLAASLCFSIRLVAETATLEPLKEGTIFSENNSASNGSGPHLHAGTTDSRGGGNHRRALFNFMVARFYRIPQGSTINSVSFALSVNRSSSGSADFSLHRLTRDWGEAGSDSGTGSNGKGTDAETGDVTWSHSFFGSQNWDTAGGGFVEDASATASVGGAGTTAQWSSAQMAVDVQDWLENPDQDFGWILMGPESGSKSAKRFDSSEGSVPVRPVLTVDFTPPSVTAPFTVNTRDDIDDGICDTSHCSLRESIESANRIAGSDTINFDILGPGPHAIQLNSSLPTVTAPVVIDGYTQPGASQNTNPPGVGKNAVLKIEIDGTGAGNSSGLAVSTDDCSIRGLVVNRFELRGIVILSGSNNTVEGNFIGTDVTGSSDLGNASVGVQIQNAPNNRIGGFRAGEGNVISGNDSGGILIVGEGASGNLVQGNYVGTDVTGASNLGNAFQGVQIQNAPNNTIGGPQTGAGNVISGNEEAGIAILLAGARGNLVEGNLIGTDVTGSVDLGNGLYGVTIQDAPGNTVGGSQEGTGNLISGNDRNGVLIAGSGSSDNLVQGNLIGTDVTGSVKVGNGASGVEIQNSPNNMIGGMQSVGNVISGNEGVGVFLRGQGSSGNLVQGNLIGTDVTGSVEVGNDGGGMEIQDSPNNTIGGMQSGEGNVISGNDGEGILILRNGSSGNAVRGNFVGTDVTGSVSLGNSSPGITIVNAPDNIIGGSQVGEGNVISGNEVNGITIAFAGSRGNVVHGNFVGTDVTGNIELGNAIYGLVVQDAPENTIGGVDLGEGNTIAFNHSSGVVVGFAEDVDDASALNPIRGNAIFSNGSLGIDLGDDGITSNDDGDPDTGPNNLQNFPILTSATGGSTRIEGTLNSAPNLEFDLDFYANSDVDESGYGEGERYLGSATAMTDGSGDVSFDVNLVANAFSGEYITATATDSSGNTSEFSKGIMVTGGSGEVDPFSGVVLGDQWFFSEWYGIYNTTFAPWIFHSEHAWQYIFPTETEGEYFIYDLECDGVWWTTSAFLPVTFYSFNRGSFNFYFVGTTGPRSFVDLQTEEFWTKP